MTHRFGAWRVLLSLFAGLALALAFPNFNLAPLGWISLAGLILASLGAGWTESALCGLAYGAAFYTLSLPWIYTVMRQYGPLPVWQAAGVLALLVLYCSLYCVAFAMILAWMSRRSAGLALLAAPFLWVGLELARTRVPDLAFPWNLLGYTASGSLALVQLTSLTGIYGLSLLVAGYNAMLAWLVRSRLLGAWNRRAVLAASASTGAILVVVFAGGGLVPAARPPTRVAHLIQPNLPQVYDYQPDWEVLHAADMAEIDRITIDAGKKRPGLVVWPEVPAPFTLQDPAFAGRVATIARQSRSDFLLGVVDWERPPGGDPAAYNSAAMIDPAGREEFLYAKMHLVPFSEYVPWRGFFWFAKDLTALVSDFHRGTHYAVGRLPGGRFSVFICYEAVFPNEVRQFVRDGAGLLINISDDGWFGRSSARAQHLAMARVRAVENRRWLLRDTNNGITVAVDPYGRIVARLAPDRRGELDAPYGFRDDLTPYTRWGDWVAWFSLLVAADLLILAGGVGRRRAARARQGNAGRDGRNKGQK